MPKKSSKLSQASQTHAKVETFAPTTLDQVWGFNESARYGTVNETEYQGKLTNMTRSDLENHARAVGCMVLESSERLRESLLRQFQGYLASLRKPTNTNPSTVKPSNAAQKILGEGR